MKLLFPPGGTKSFTQWNSCFHSSAMGKRAVGRGGLLVLEEEKRGACVGEYQEKVIINMGRSDLFVEIIFISLKVFNLNVFMLCLLKF